MYRVDAGNQIGLGHLMRCQALAQALAHDSIEQIFVVKEQTQQLIQTQHSWQGKSLVMPDNIELAQEVDWITLQARLADADYVVLDGYQFTQGYRNQLKQHFRFLILFDDNNNSGDLHADLVINAAQNATSLGYEKTAPAAIACLGSDFHLLRQEFYVAQPLKWHLRHALTIMLGGSDPFNFTLPIIEAFNRLAADIPLRVITGAAYQKQDELQGFMQSSAQAIQHIHDCQNMADMFNHTRLAISAAGGSQFELQACCTPSFLLVVADNQLNATQQAAKNGHCLAFDMRNNADVVPMVKQAIDYWRHDNKLQQMHQQLLALPYTNGAVNIVEAIYQLDRKTA
nr:UDP-2,4-diacetamido-2,4,6-trideoxy-beta-L-altropyranose hydrolase [Neptunicella marina]